MATIEFVTIEVADTTAADRFYTTAFGVGGWLRVRASEAPANGFRGFTLSLLVSQPATANSFIGSALDAGATSLKPAAKSLWGYGGAVQAPDGTIWTVASSSKKDSRCDPVPSAETPATLALVIGSDAGPFTDPDGFVWE